MSKRSATSLPSSSAHSTLPGDGGAVGTLVAVGYATGTVPAMTQATRLGRTGCPVAHGGEQLMADPAAWATYRAAGVEAVRCDTQTTVVLGRNALADLTRSDACSASGSVMFEGLPPMPPGELDGDEHAVWRNIARLVLAATPVDAPAATAERLLGTLPDSGEFEAVEFARRYVSSSFASAVARGVGQERWESWGYKLACSRNDPRVSFAVAAAIAVDFEKSKVTGQMARPQRIVLEALPEVSSRQYAAFVLLMLYAGVESTRSVVASTVWHLGRNEGMLDRLVDGSVDRQLFADEMIRLYAPVSTGRTVVSDFQLAGVDVRAGERVVACFPAASRDCAAGDSFNEAHSDLSFTFGRGSHRCLGVEFARSHVAGFVGAFATLASSVTCFGEPVWTSGIIRGPERVDAQLVWRSGGA